MKFLLTLFLLSSFYYTNSNGLKIKHRINAPLDDYSQETRWNTKNGQPSKFSGHRGEVVFMPENTIGSYEFASLFLADLIETDIVLTSDGELACLHDLSLKRLTNIASLPQFADRRQSINITVGTDTYRFVNDWLVDNFTLAELKEIKVIQRNVGIRPQYFNDLFYVPSFQEYLDVIKNVTNKMNTTSGLIVEFKNPKFFNRNHADNYMENKFLEIMLANGFDLTLDHKNCGNDWDICPHIVLQSFEKEGMIYFNQSVNPSAAEITYLADGGQPLEFTPGGLKSISLWAQSLVINKGFVYHGVAEEYDRRGVTFTDEMKEQIEGLGGFIQNFATEAHNNGMEMGVYTVYDSRENSISPDGKEAEIFKLFFKGMDIIVVENMPESREMRTKYNHMLLKNTNDTNSGSSLIIQNILMCTALFLFYFSSTNLYTR